MNAVITCWSETVCTFCFIIGKKRVYTTDFKIKIVASSLDIGKMPTARLFGINEKLIRDWSKRKDIVHAATKMNNAPKKSPINLTPQSKFY